MKLPAGMVWWRKKPGGDAWLQDLPRLAEECAAQWSLRLGDPYGGSNMSLVLPARLSAGAPVVVKLYFPGGEGASEACALAWWQGMGAVLLIAHDADRGALLLEACDPGTPLARIPDDDQALQLAASLLRRLWRPAPHEHALEPLATRSASWAERLPAQWESLGRRFDRALVDEAVSAVRDLAPTQGGEQVVLHGDFHSGNVLRARRESWLAIDPLPLVGERAFDAASLLRDRRWPITARSLARRLDFLCGKLDLDRERVRRWGIVHALDCGVSWAKSEQDLLLAARLLSSDAA